VDNGVVLDLLAEVEERPLGVSVPPGSKAESLVQLKSYDLLGDTRPLLYMHPPASASTRVWLPSDARLELAIAMDPSVWDKGGDGVTYRVTLRDGEASETLFSRHLDPRSRPADRRWVESTLDLGRFARHTVELVFSADPGASADFDWGGWARPRVVIGRTHGAQ
jgi:hypothetical protein